jgi:hypothetical protein
MNPDELNTLLGAGWNIVSDGPSGIQLQRKKMKGLDKACLILGGVLIFAYGIGLFFILIALIDYFFLTKPETLFVPR